MLTVNTPVKKSGIGRGTYAAALKSVRAEVVGVCKTRMRTVTVRTAHKEKMYIRKQIVSPFQGNWQ